MTGGRPKAGKEEGAIKKNNSGRKLDSDPAPHPTSTDPSTSKHTANTQIPQTQIEKYQIYKFIKRAEFNPRSH